MSWTKINSALKLYVINVSEVGNEVKCVECKKVTPANGWSKERDAEGEVIAWTYLCPCGTTMKIFNE